MLHLLAAYFYGRFEMSIAVKHELIIDAEYMTRPEFAFYSKQPYSTIMDYIRRGEIEMFLINGQIKINVAEATRVLEARIRKPRLKMDLFA
jgi:hypothetical protein